MTVIRPRWTGPPRCAPGTARNLTSRTANIYNTQEIDALVTDCHARFGRIDVLVNNVGGSAPGDVVSLESDVWETQFDHNINYVFQTMKRVVPIMAEQGGGAIVNLASIAALRFFGPDCVAYAASKAGLIKMSQVTAVKYAKQHVRVNTVVPGLMNTPLVTERLVKQRGDGDAEKLIAATSRPGSDGAHGRCLGRGRSSGVPRLGRRKVHHGDRTGCRWRPAGPVASSPNPTA